MRQRAKSTLVIEDVAKAIYAITAEKVTEATYNPHSREMPDVLGFEQATEAEQELHREYARAAIKALPGALGL